LDIKVKQQGGEELHGGKLPFQGSARDPRAGFGDSPELSSIYGWMV
jgi:hypothetical protein